MANWSPLADRSLLEEVIPAYSGSPFPVITTRQTAFKLHPKRLTGHLSFSVMAQKYCITATPALQRGSDLRGGVWMGG